MGNTKSQHVPGDHETSKLKTSHILNYFSFNFLHHLTLERAERRIFLTKNRSENIFDQNNFRAEMFRFY